MTAATGTRIDPSLSHLTTYTGDGSLAATATIAAGEELVVVAS